jgi:hypothetical protein
LSKTHSELKTAEWGDLNEKFHHYLENEIESGKINQPPYAEQAIMISLLVKNEIINSHSMLDYAAGYGTLSKILHRYFDIAMPVYDPFVKTSGSARYIEKPVPHGYSAVMNSAMFEHVLNRNDLDNVNDLVNAVRSTYLPGDNLDLKILKEGKEPSQGVGYLDDGTMVVVEEGSNYVGGELRVVVTSALQTSAGRMIFAKPQASALA